MRSALKTPTIRRSLRIKKRNCSIDIPPPFCESAFPSVVMAKKTLPAGRSTSHPVSARSIPLCSRTNFRRSCGNFPSTTQLTPTGLGSFRKRPSWYLSRIVIRPPGSSLMATAALTRWPLLPQRMSIHVPCSLPISGTH